MSHMSDFDDYHFLYPKIGVSAWILKNFSSLLKKGYLRQPFVKFLQQWNDYSDIDLVLKLFDDFLASRYASLTTKVVILYGP